MAIVAEVAITNLMENMNNVDKLSSIIDLESLFPDGIIVGGERLVDLDAMRYDMTKIIAKHKENKKKRDRNK